jgi:hypothetical protein
MYAKENKDKPFLLDHCWKILQDSQKWWMETPADPVPISPGTSDYPGTPISLDSDHDPNPYSVNSPSRASKRPTGRKAEKESRRKIKIVEEDDSVFISLLQKFNQNAEESKIEKKLLAEQRLLHLKAVEAREQRKLAVLETAELREQMKHDSAIMTLDTTNMSPELQHYYKMLKNEIMAKVYARSSSSQFYIPSPPDTQE